MRLLTRYPMTWLEYMLQMGQSGIEGFAGFVER